MRGKKLLTAVALSAVLFAGCGLKNNETAITVNGSAISKGSIDQAINAQIKNSPFTKMGIDIKNTENDFLYLLTKDRVINELIIKTLISSECEKRDITITKNELALAMEDLISKIGSKERFNDYLKQKNISKSQFEKDFEQELKIKKLASQLEKIEVTEADAKKFYRENVKKFQYPDKVRVLRVVDKIENKYMIDEYKENMYKTDINREEEYMEDKYKEDKYKKGSRSLMEVMVINEIMRRRIRRRNCRQRGFC